VFSYYKYTHTCGTAILLTCTYVSFLVLFSYMYTGVYSLFQMCAGIFCINVYTYTRYTGAAIPVVLCVCVHVCVRHVYVRACVCVCKRESVHVCVCIVSTVIGALSYMKRSPIHETFKRRTPLHCPRPRALAVRARTCHSNNTATHCNSLQHTLQPTATR